jgi:transcriptional regulator with XRE-family HTH domain
MTGANEITEALKRCLKARAMTYAALGRALGLSEASVKRLFSSGSFSLKRVERICAVLDMDLFELVRLARGEAPAASTLSVLQEQALAADARLLLVFHLLLADWTLEEIVRHYDVSRAQCIALMASLERLELIELRARNTVRLRTARQVSWRPGGPIRQAYETQVLGEFLDGSFHSPPALLHFEAKELSGASREVMLRKLKHLLREFNEFAEIDAAMPPEERESLGLVLAMRPYVLSAFSALKRRRAKPSARKSARLK